MCRESTPIIGNPFKERYGLLLMLMVGLVYAWFYNGANANQASRYDVAFSCVESGTADTGTFRINRFVVQDANGRWLFSNTCDWARNEKKGRDFYSNKAPLPSLLAIPVYAVIYRVERIAGVDPLHPHLTYLNCYLINLVVSVLPMALSAVLAFSMLVRLTGGRRMVAFLSCIGLYFGTLAFPFSTQLWGHSTGLAFCVIGTYFALDEERRYGPVLAGLFLGLSVLCDYTCAIGVFSVGVWFLACRKKKVFLYVLGGLPTLALYVAYHKICFDSFLMPASSFSNPTFIEADDVGGLFNLSSVWTALKGLIVSPYRGIFWYMPCLLGILMVIPKWKTIRRKDVVALGLATAFVYLLLNVSFNGWHGGESSGPRYQIVAFGWYLIVIACSFNRTEKPVVTTRVWVKWAMLGLLVISIANMFVVTTVTPMAHQVEADLNPDERKIRANPLPFFYGTFLQGNHQISARGFFPIRPGEIPRHAYRYKTFMLGKFLGLPGNLQVVPPVLFLILGIGIGVRWMRNEEEMVKSAR